MKDFKVRCVNNSGNPMAYTIGKIYEISPNGTLTTDNECQIGYGFKTVEDINEYSSSVFELVTESKQFTKSDLRTGMRVETKEGNTYVVIQNLGCYDVAFCKNGTYFDGESMSEDMEFDGMCESLSISKVFDAPRYGKTLDVTAKGSLLYQRTEPIKYTIAEAEAALTEAEGKPVEIVKG